MLKKKGEKYGPQADLWSLGVVMYELLIGKLPFYGEDLKKLQENMNNAVINYPKSVNISYEAISFLNGLLQFDPEKRMTYEQLWAHPFMIGKVSSFHKLNLTLNKDNIKNLQIDSKSEENLMWICYSDGDKIGVSLNDINDKYLESKFNYNYFQKEDKKYAGLELDNDFDIRDVTEFSFVNLKKKKKKKVLKLKSYLKKNYILLKLLKSLMNKLFYN